MEASAALPPSRSTSRPMAEARVSGEQTAWREKRGIARSEPSTRSGAAVDPDDGSRGEARRPARQVDGGADDLRGLAAALEGERRLGSPPEGGEVPRLADVREERTGLDGVHSHLVREGAGEAHGHGFEPGLRGGLRSDVRRRTG